MRNIDPLVTAGCLFLLALFPVLVSDAYYRHIMNVACIYAIGIYGFNIITGITGQLNLAHAGFMGIGAYISALVATRLSLGFWMALPLAAAGTGLAGLLIGLPSLRTRGVYFALTTLGFGEILFIVFDNWIPVTGGPMGFTGIDSPEAIGPLNFNSKVVFYYLSLVGLVFAAYASHILINSRLGRAMLAVRENEDLARSVGISIVGSKIWAFVLAMCLIGISGSLYAHYFRFISPVSFTVGESFRCLTMLVVGGMGTLAGPLVGSVLFTYLPEFLRAIEQYQLIVYGAVLMLCIAFLPEGLVGFLKMKVEEKALKSDEEPS